MSNSQNALSTMAQTSLRGPRMSGSSNQADAGGSSSSQHDLAEKCLSIVEDYKHTIISKSKAYVSITKAVSTATNEAMDQAESFITSLYFNMLDEWARGLDRGRNQWDSDAAARRSEVRESVPPRENERRREPSVERDEPIRNPEFHEAGWREIVTGKCVNLNTVDSIISSSRTIDKCTKTIGDIEIKYAKTS
ncbi:hypothetical protein EV702DRAFT_1043903 [Suillus placidus]|uniref:Uncharacterized protein n=1 Tax=Suillus placidus TaxID=48579 RepID=A0A9P7D4T9_9AGAM|nr:hypothetical protein EV702DRAFT_1043903 [Suillus placidus]